MTPGSLAAVECPSCGAMLPVFPGESIACPSCRTDVRLLLFPAFVRQVLVGTAAVTAASEEATCYDHPANVAVIACERSGRFVCSLCDIETDGAHICPACFSAAPHAGGAATERVLWDSVALYAAILPCIFWWATLVSSCAVLILVARKWN